jgi:hypothetical protein
MTELSAIVPYWIVEGMARMGEKCRKIDEKDGWE